MQPGRPPLELLLSNLEQRSKLDDQGRAAVLALPITLRTLEPGSFTIREADAPENCAILISGFAFRQKLTGDGQRQILSIHLPGEALDFQNLFLDVSDHSVQMLTRGTVAFVSRAVLHELIRANPSVAHAVLVKTLVEASIFREWVLNVGQRNSRERMAHLLCELGVRLEAEGLSHEYGYELPMTQEQLGDALGLTPVHVNRVLKALEADGLIVRTRRNVSFPDWERLRQLGDFNQRYLHFGPQQSGSPLRNYMGG